MEIQFERMTVPYLQNLAGQLRSQEQTLEVRLPDGMPDIGRVLGAWGQVIVRGKEWTGESMGVSCGVMVWVLYTPEEEDGVRSVEAWLPFAMKWELPDSRYEGKILTSCLLRGVDARSTSARKLMVRATLDAMADAWISGDGQVAVPSELPEDIKLLTADYPVQLPREAGEKAFVLEEQITAPVSPKIEKLMYYSLQPEILDRKVMAGKIVFRGIGLLHLLYRDEDERLHSWDCELPFSQYADLDGEYDQDPSVNITPCVTSLDLTLDETGMLQLKAGILAQYLLCDRTMLTVVEDAYSPKRSVVPQSQQLQLPSILDQTAAKLHGEYTAQADVQQVVDLQFNPAWGQLQPTEQGIQLAIPGQFQMLYYDPEDTLCSLTAPWEGEWSLHTAPDAVVGVRILPAGNPQAIPGAGDVSLRADVCGEATVTSGRGIPMITGLEIGEIEKPDPDRPSLILCRKGNKRLWDVAKEAGSTVETIMQANRLEEEPEAERILLIPIS